MRPWAVVAVAVATAAATVLTIVSVALRGGISARPDPSALEAGLARSIRHWAIPAEARGARNPVSASPHVLADGLAHFADHCASCHANDGSGQTRLGRGLFPRAPDMRRTATQELTDGELFYIIENGVRLTGMPAWGGPGTAEGTWHLVHFIRHLPKLTDEEKARMEALNPRSPAEWRALQDEESFLRGETTPSREPGHADHAH